MPPTPDSGAGPAAVAAIGGAAPRRTPLHPALCRPVLYGGVAPELLFLEVSALFLLLFEVGLHLATLALSLVYLLAFHPLAAYLCARDPLIVRIYARSLRHADHYAPAPHLGARVRAADPALPGAP
jgi:type IV secretory pathway TrbD component